MPQLGQILLSQLRKWVARNGSKQPSAFPHSAGFLSPKSLPNAAAPVEHQICCLQPPHFGNVMNRWDPKQRLSAERAVTAWGSESTAHPLGPGQSSPAHTQLQMGVAWRLAWEKLRKPKCLNRMVDPRVKKMEVAERGTREHISSTAWDIPRHRIWGAPSQLQASAKLVCE